MRVLQTKMKIHPQSEARREGSKGVKDLLVYNREKFLPCRFCVVINFLLSQDFSFYDLYHMSEVYE